jgi:CHASE3 domain sensor protein
LLRRGHRDHRDLGALHDDLRDVMDDLRDVMDDLRNVMDDLRNVMDDLRDVNLMGAQRKVVRNLLVGYLPDGLAVRYDRSSTLSHRGNDID